ncbi:hypothetical protein K466DRAFT_85636 [Polyporus arcularius HHB13444]|uniref:WW domain-containing protein n=1 Tax=Polyporus arcularius HHB13444 TaxID=1314778 RepID=A0A5C3PEY2_9APHY|nr:hypothetical protein K466DRAFT_85636 [Polyporus arcularius HHB13444]
MQPEAETTVPPVPKSLIATIPSWSSRYDQTGSRCKPAQWVVRPGISQSQPRYLPPTWNSYIQPEGQLYFASDATPRTVTDVNFHDDVKQEKVVRFAELACKIAEARNIVLPETSELYLEPAKTEDSAYYYFVDHATQTVFWLDEHNSESFGLDDVVSETQSAFLLEYQYWYHIQCFPSHRAHHLSLRLDELIPVFLHGECDQRTSPTSTFPYAAKQCKEFLRLLQYAKENPYSPFNVCFVARLWSILANHRHFTFYGQPLARLDRTQIVVDHPERKRGLVFAAASHLLLGVPESYGGRLEECWIDNVAIDYVWTDFLARTRGEWRESLIMSFGLSLFNALLLLIPGTSELLAIASLLCCAVATLSSLALGSRPYPVIVEAAVR